MRDSYTKGKNGHRIWDEAVLYPKDLRKKDLVAMGNALKSCKENDTIPKGIHLLWPRRWGKLADWIGANQKNLPNLVGKEEAQRLTRLSYVLAPEKLAQWKKEIWAPIAEHIKKKGSRKSHPRLPDCLSPDREMQKAQIQYAINQVDAFTKDEISMLQELLLTIEKKDAIWRAKQK